MANFSMLKVDCTFVGFFANGDLFSPQGKEDGEKGGEEEKEKEERASLTNSAYQVQG